MLNKLLSKYRKQRSIYKAALNQTTFDEHKAFWKGKIEMLDIIISDLETLKTGHRNVSGER